MSSSFHATRRITCFYCDKLGYKAYSYKFKKLNGKLVKQVWIPKETLVTNPK